MRFSGKIYKDGRFWLAEIPILDAVTQGHTRKEALEMAADMVETMPIRLTQVGALRYAPGHVRLPSDPFGISASLP